MQAVLLHLSDIHIKTHNDPILKKGKDIAACIYSCLPSASHVFILVSGDVAFSGEDFQYVLATDFLREIQAAIQNETSIPVSFVVAPGNHDCDFKQNSGVRKILVKSIESSDPPEIDSSIIETCTSIQKAFFEFRKNLEGNNASVDDLLWRSSRFDIGGKILGFECLNISWVSNLPETPGYLYYPVNRYREKQNDDIDVRLLVLHQPLNWFNQSIYRPFREFVRQLADIVISGHEHQGNVGIVDEAESDKSVFVEGCVLQEGKDLSGSSFNIMIIDLAHGQFVSTQYYWDGTRYIPKEEGSWSNYHNLPAKKKNYFAISESFQEVLDDPGAFFKHPGRSHLTLGDIFIYPDLKKVNNGDERRRSFISSDKLLDLEVIAGGVLIEGEEKVGCTSLLYRLYRQYHEMGIVPLFLNGRKLKNAHDTDIDAAIKSEVVAQYGKNQVAAFDQLPATQKLLLLDDFDDGPLRAVDARVGLLCALKKRFGHMVVTVNEMFEIREILDGDASRELISLEHYQIQTFGYARRTQLIEQWFSLGRDGTVDEASFISMCDQAERLMSAVMTKRVIPSIPLYLLTLLQSMEAGRSGDFRESALGYYYQYLLTEAFQNSGVKPDKLTEVFQYATRLAAEFHSHGKRELSYAELREFNHNFSREWHTVDFGARIELLVRSRVLCRVGEDYAFRYPYIYFYLKGQYISENLTDIEIRKYVDHCCQHLYVRDHANTILFLAHHTSNDYLLGKIAEALHGLFQARAPITFGSDTSCIRKLIDDAPKLTYSGESPSQHRKKISAIRDDLDGDHDGHDGLAELEEKSEELSLVAQMTMLFKTTEILGQVLKNQYSKIQRTRKASLLEELFNGPLRALQDFYHYFENNTDTLVSEIEAAIQRKEKTKNEERLTKHPKIKPGSAESRNKIAREVVAGIVQIVSFSFVMRAAQGANSDSLIEDVRDVVKKNGTLAFKLIELCIILDSPKAFPRQKLEELHNESKRDLVAMRLVHMMVINRLYMFKTTEQDMQWLSEKLNIDITIQHAITYQHNKQRLAQ